ncbi:sigma-70 family RNA polymerase sigma factor [Amycolatopsis thermophila]|uniref:RNA polymerase sigma factor (Sigma-70 family) n=1 Tax=Amycolatopsis thermophila TaxID=206084 RepID=A0ABU0F641_9PSEU|nr:sigma-70 family RNA polymerase sigma factor [Amycolatopsis thermophila]MDQ0383059.1 RNA polymerase sigma factor (sigma-70 family) [Amycolatopsis thermophila]
MAGDGDIDAELIEAVRAGDVLAYDRLFRRHLPAARRVASMVWRDRSEVDDLVAESFLRVFAAIRDGKGPAGRFRPYLLVTLRNLALDWGRRRDRCDAAAADREDGAPGVEEIVVDRLTGEVALAAFRTLPARWRYVLWHIELAGTWPGQLAGELGLSPNGVAALAARAREGLRQAFLQAHVPAASAPECREVRRRLAAWTRADVTDRQRRVIATHLEGCPECRRVAALLDNVNSGLPALALVPLLGRLPLSAVAGGGGVTTLSKVAAAVTLAAVTVTAAPAVPLGTPSARPGPRVAAAAPTVPVSAQAVPVAGQPVLSPGQVLPAEGGVSPAVPVAAQPDDQGRHRGAEARSKTGGSAHAPGRPKAANPDRPRKAYRPLPGRAKGTPKR